MASDRALDANLDLIRDAQRDLAKRQSELEQRAAKLESELGDVRTEQEKIRFQLAAFADSLAGLLD